MTDFVKNESDIAIEEENLVFIAEKHLQYIKKISSDTTSFEFAVTQHLRMSGVYWGLTAVSVLGKDLYIEMDAENIIDWVIKCQHENGILKYLYIIIVFNNFIYFFKNISQPFSKEDSVEI